MLPQVHLGEIQQILLVRDSDDHERLLALRLWKTEFRHHTDSHPLWVGNVSYLIIDKNLRLLQFLRTDPDYSNALNEFIQDIGDINYHSVQRDSVLIEHHDMLWSGKTLLIGGD